MPRLYGVRVVEPRPISRGSQRDRLLEVYDEVRRFAVAIAPVGVFPDELVQEAITRVLERIRLEDIDDLAGYLRRIIFNLVIDERRKSRRLSRLLPRLLQIEPNRFDDYPSDLQVLLQLDPQARALLYLVDVEGWSVQETARFQCVPEGTARMRLLRARRRLRRLLEEKPTPS